MVRIALYIEAQTVQISLFPRRWLDSSRGRVVLITLSMLPLPRATHARWGGGFDDTSQSAAPGAAVGLRDDRRERSRADREDLGATHADDRNREQQRHDRHAVAEFAVHEAVRDQGQVRD